MPNPIPPFFTRRVFERPPETTLGRKPNGDSSEMKELNNVTQGIGPLFSPDAEAKDEVSSGIKKFDIVFSIPYRSMENSIEKSFQIKYRILESKEETKKVAQKISDLVSDLKQLLSLKENVDAVKVQECKNQIAKILREYFPAVSLERLKDLLPTITMINDSSRALRETFANFPDGLARTYYPDGSCKPPRSGRGSYIYEILSRIDLSNTDLSFVNFEEFNLYYTNLSNCDLTGSSFRRMRNFNGTIFDGCKIDFAYLPERLFNTPPRVHLDHELLEQSWFLKVTADTALGSLFSPETDAKEESSGIKKLVIQTLDEDEFQTLDKDESSVEILNSKTFQIKYRILESKEEINQVAQKIADLVSDLKQLLHLKENVDGGKVQECKNQIAEILREYFPAVPKNLFDDDDIQGIQTKINDSSRALRKAIVNAPDGLARTYYPDGSCEPPRSIYGVYIYETLSRINLSNTDLSFVNFGGFHLYGTNFSNCDLTGSSFIGMPHFNGAIFDGCKTEFAIPSEIFNERPEVFLNDDK